MISIHAPFLQLSGIMHLVSQFNDFSWYYAPNTTIQYLFRIISSIHHSCKFNAYFLWYYAPNYPSFLKLPGIMHLVSQSNHYSLVLCTTYFKSIFIFKIPNHSHYYYAIPGSFTLQFYPLQIYIYIFLMI